MTKRIFDVDEDTGLITWYEDLDGDENGSFALHTTQDCTAIVERNKTLQNTGNEAWKAGGDFRLEASVPMIFLHKWATEDGIPPDKVFSEEFAGRIARRLNDSDYRHFKTFDGRV